ncbi:hypothetical protein KM043_011595 [Ampulex compressa]|nr:hypothetical protein KM043_011595 [Ampulex compressa]
MQNTRVDIFCCLIVAALVLSPFGYAGNDTNRMGRCDMEKLVQQCGQYGRCVQRYSNKEPQCECLRHFELVDGECVQSKSTANDTATVPTDIKPSSGGSSVAAGLLIPTFLVVIGVLLYFGARRYKWLQRFRQYRQNRYGNVLVTRDDDDDDDPPIA